MGEAIVWAAALGPELAARAALVARPLTPPWWRELRHLPDYRVIQRDIKVRRRRGHCGYASFPRPEKGKGEKRAAGVPAASVATAVDLGGQEGGVLQ
jgi:hypothetical protein